jgi:hypothetical protein
MLISHGKRFIYTKTVKTAGTSVESYFEPHCMKPGEWTFSHGRSEYVSDAGIVGIRTASPIDLQAVTWWNHMPARTIRALIGESIWSQYFKFCVVRNPFEKMVSAYHFFHEARPTEDRPASLLSTIKNAIVGPKTVDTLKSDFENWLKSVPMPLDQNKYIIDGEFCMDYVIRYESLEEGLREVSRLLNLEFEPQRLPHLKKSDRPRIPLEHYYSRASLDLIERAYAFELSRFGYTFPTSTPNVRLAS